ncbi:CvpA family protein [Ostreiculturibacter nitratireducens]|uniref:CvpA family protein n=1 Tax=Ostreiculturibacter nitratireducens TaxID=3075226 RepID=UPI0031B64B57
MEGFTVVDAVVAVVIVLSAILAYSRGFVREALAIGGWIAAAVIAFIFAEQVRPMVAQVPVLDKFLGDSCELAMIAAFAAVFAVALVVFAIFTPLFASVVQRSALSGIDQGLGFLFGVLRGIVLVAVAFVVYDRALVDQAVPVVSDSRSAEVFARMEQSLNEQLPQDAPGWIVARYDELMSSCGPRPESAPAAETPPAEGSAAPAAGN